MKKFLMFTSICLALGTVAQASNYPADMASKTSCQELGSVKVCRAIQYSGLAVLDIYYNGFLKSQPGLKAFVRVNYLDGSRQNVFAMRPYDSRSYVRITGGCVVGSLGGCQVSGTQEMRDLLLWAQRPYSMTLNALDLEVAFVSDSQEAGWDNNGGFAANYHFYFPED